MNETKTGGNRLIREKSPYLLQHARNPVDWYPWSEEAFETAKREDKPIFLSIGYSTCHWCHVMERESFEDGEVARLMNETFVSVKVDREERPDIDKLYMNVAQMMTGSGGWPLTIIMTPEQKPFYVGTYIPKHSFPKRIGMMDLIPAIKEAWQTRREEIGRSSEQILAALAENLNQDLKGENPSREDLDLAFEQLVKAYESEYGGFGSSPKFPTPHNLSFLLRYWKRTGEARALEMVEKTLTMMRLGGIYDHVGFGFHRYSVDSRWLVPHFEKMLYDQAMLASAYLDAYQATGRRLYAGTAEEIFTYVLRDMTSPEGGFYSAEDADSEGVEGKFYLWTAEELRKVLGTEAQAVIERYGVTDEGNFGDDASGARNGVNILHLGNQADLSEKGGTNWEPNRKRLFDAREKRIHPLKDDKILTDWNGLMIAALARGGRILGKPEYTRAAARAADFVLTSLVTPEGRLLHRFRTGEAAHAGNLDDYAFVVMGLIELYQASFETRYLKEAISLTDAMMEDFWDEADGGFFFTPDDGEELLIRGKETYDGAVPSGNAVAMLDLLHLSRLTGTMEYGEHAAGAGRTFSKNLKSYPSAHTFMMGVVDFIIGPSLEIVLAGSPGAADTENMLREINAPFLPNKVVLLKSADSSSGTPDRKSPAIEELAPFTEHQSALEGKATVYVCENFACELPTTDIEKLRSLLAKRDSSRERDSSRKRDPSR